MADREIYQVEKMWDATKHRKRLHGHPSPDRTQRARGGIQSLLNLRLMPFLQTWMISRRDAGGPPYLDGSKERIKRQMRALRSWMYPSNLVTSCCLICTPCLVQPLIGHYYVGLKLTLGIWTKTIPQQTTTTTQQVQATSGRFWMHWFIDPDE